jgi:uncharacterized repeat protein (TIGR03806 family)
VILEWHSLGHNGGDLAFGRDGMLYITAGDGTSDSDTWNSGQTLDDLLGNVLRIDVSGGDGKQLYKVPRDNPFVDLPDARGEIWAYGLRNPWRMSVDRKTGHLWVGNNGQDLWETAHLVRRGENYGWSVYEGNHPFYPQRKRGPTPHVAPTIEHSHAEFRSLTGGVVYYGARLPELEGAYIYGDYASGRIWGMKHDGRRPIWHRELADTALQIAGFCVDQRGELLVVDHGTGIYRLAPAPKRDPLPRFPMLLSETGLFESVKERRPAAGLIPYVVNAPAWNDGAVAERLIALPGNTRIDHVPGGSWNFPDGAALVETLQLEREPDHPLPAARIETRVLLRQQGEWAGYSYRWNAEQTDAQLVPKEGASAEWTVRDGPHGAAGPQAWRFPSRAECLSCHSRAANFVLGVSDMQLDREHDQGGTRDNQLLALDRLGVFSKPLPKQPQQPPRAVDPYDAGGDVELRVRSYLHVNCSVCHVSAGGGNAQMELGFATARDAMKLLAARPQHDSFGLADAMLVAPGDPDRSVLVHRLSRRGPGQMPPLVSSRVDERAVELVRQWIAGLKAEQAIVQKWTMEDLLPQLEQVKARDSVESGQVAFRKTGCNQCHRFAGEGGTVGPDLSGVEKRLAARELLESILLPSKVIAEGYASYAIETDEGQVVAGRIEREDSDVVVVRPTAAASVPVEIKKASIVERRHLAVSNMPEGTVDVLEKEQVLDLLAYLLGGPGANPR